VEISSSKLLIVLTPGFTLIKAQWTRSLGQKVPPASLFNLTITVLKRFLQHFKQQRDTRPESAFPELQADIGQKYVLLERLDRETYLAAGPDGLPYRLKRLSPDPDYLQKVKREFRVCSELESHPHLAPFTDADFVSEAPWLARRELDGVHATVSLRQSPLSPEFVKKFLQDGLAALEHLQKNSIVCHDLQPKNLLFCDEHWVICDLPFHTPQRFVVGSRDLKLDGLFYMPPEFFMEATVLESNLYSLGAMAFHLLVGDPPFKGDEPMEVVFGILTKECPDIAHLRPDLPRLLTDKIQTLLSKEPAERTGGSPFGMKPQPQSPPSEQVIKFLQDASNQGMPEGIGQFTLDPKKALEKLRDYQFSEPIVFLRATLLAAGGLKAKAVSITSSAREMEIVFDGSIVDLGAMKSALLAACEGREDNPVTHLGLALVGALGAGCKRVELRGGGHKVTFTDLTEPTVSTARDDGFVVRCLGVTPVKSVPRAFLREISLSRIQIRWNGESLCGGLESGETFVVTPRGEQFELDIDLNAQSGSSGLYLRTHLLCSRVSNQLLFPRVRVIIDGPWKRDASYQIIKDHSRVTELEHIANGAVAVRLAERMLEGPIDWTHSPFFRDVIRALDDNELLNRLHSHIVLSAPECTTGYNAPRVSSSDSLSRFVWQSCEYVRDNKLPEFERASELLTQPRYFMCRQQFEWEATVELARDAFGEDEPSQWRFLFWAWLSCPSVTPPLACLPDLLSCCSQISPAERGLWDLPLSTALLRLETPWALKEHGLSIPSKGFGKTRSALGI
jgi:serine/threonine protein kinase